jgi:hypothetical protein
MALLGLVSSLFFFPLLLLPFPPYHHQNCLLYFSRREGKLKERKGAIKHHSGMGAISNKFEKRDCSICYFLSSSSSCLSGGLCLFYLDRGDLVGLFSSGFRLAPAAFFDWLGD